jgi:tetratricopeptide (TPR) repeat protein
VQQGRLAEALVRYDQAIALQSDYGQAWCNRGNLLQMHHQIEAAVESCDRAIALNPEYVDAYWNKANALLLGGFVRGWPQSQLAQKWSISAHFACFRGHLASGDFANH